MRKVRLTRRDDGFTLLELLVVLIVVSILAALALPLFLNQSRIAVDAGVKSDVRNTAGAVFNWLRNHPSTPAANTAEYLSQNGKLTISRASDTKMSVQVAENGLYVVCAYDAGGNDYNTPEKAWAFSSDKGNFDTVAKIMGAGASCSATSGTSGSGSGSTTSPPQWSTAATLPNAEVNENYNRSLTATGAPTPTYEVNSDSKLPKGLILNGTSGSLSGTPTETGLYTFTITASNSQGSSARTFTLRVATFTTAPEWNTEVQLKDGTVGAAYSTTLDAVGNPTPTYELQSGSSFPAGLSMNANSGAIVGTPTTAGDAAFTVLAKNSKGSTPRTFFIHVNAAGGSTGGSTGGGSATPDPDPSSSTPVGGTTPSSTDGAPDWKTGANLDGGVQNSAYSSTVSADASPAATYALASGSSLPGGLSLNKASGELSGTPSVYGTFSFKIIAKNSSGSASRTFSLAIERQKIAPAWTTNASLPDGEQASSYAAQVQATGYPDPTYTLASGSTLPAGLTLNNNSGLISGTPTVYGSFMFTVIASNAKASSNRTFFLNLAKTRVVPAFNTPATLNGGEQGVAYSTTISADGEPAPNYVVAANSSLPAGLSLNTTSGVLSGTASVYGTFSFGINAVNSKGTATRTFSLTLIKQRVAPTFTGSATLPAAEVATAYSTTLTADGEPAPTFALASGSSLPAGLSLSNSGAISGTPTANGNFAFTVTASNVMGSVNRSYTVAIAKTRVAPAWTTAASLTAGEQNSAYSATLVASGEPAPTFALASGANLPAGLSLSSGGALSGTPTVYGSFSFTVTASNSKGSADRTFSLSLAKERMTPAFTTGASLPDAAQNSAYSTTLVASGEPAPSYTISSGSLPSGLSLDVASGVISGTPTAYGSFSFTVTATNSKGTASRTFTLNVARQAIAPSFNTASLPNAVTTQSYSQQLSASGYPDPTFALAPGSSLPAGLSLSSTGLISGTPTQSGPVSFSVVASSSAGSDSRTFTIVVNAAPVINTASLASGQVGQSYNQSISVSGFPTPSVSVSGLPAGLSYSGGAISGTPTANGSFSVTITANNGVGTAASRNYTLAIAGTLAAPTNIRVTKLFGNQVSYAWNPVTNATSYTVTVSGATTDGSTSSFSTTNTSASGVIGIGEYSSALNVSVVATASGYVNSPSGTGSISTPGRRLNNGDLTACPGLYYDQNTIVNGRCALTSFDGRWTAIMQGDGNFVIYFNDLGTGAVKYWFAVNRGGTGNRLSVQADGNMVIYNSANTALTATNTYLGNTGANVAMGNGGDLYLRRNDTNDIIWRNLQPIGSTNTYFVDYVGGTNVQADNFGAESDSSGNTRWSTYFSPDAGYTTEDKHDGNRSWKVYTQARGGWPEGFINGVNLNVAPNERIFIALWVKGTAGERWTIAGREENQYNEGMGAYDFTTNGQWQLINVVYNTTYTSTQVNIQARQVTPGAGKTLYSDSMSVYRGYPG